MQVGVEQVTGGTYRAVWGMLASCWLATAAVSWSDACCNLELLQASGEELLSLLPSNAGRQMKCHIVAGLRWGRALHQQAFSSDAGRNTKSHNVAGL